MDLAVTQALTGLLPGAHGDLPPELLELANALLTQSRSQASSLKGDEEIARSYACAHLACNRLKRSSALTKIEPKPPCPPRVYQSLYRHFDNILPAGTKRRGRPPRQRTEDVHAPSHNVPEVMSSTSILRGVGLLSQTKPALNPVSTGQQDQAEFTSLRRASTWKQVSSGPSKAVPSWVMPCIHKLCRVTGASAAPSHVYVGTSTALTIFSSTLPGLASDRASVHEWPRIVSLIAAVYLSVVFRMSGRRVTGQEFEDEARQALRAMDTSEAKLIDSMDDMLKGVNAWMEQFEGKGFLGMEWLQNVPKTIVGEKEADHRVFRPCSDLGIRSFKGVEDVEQGKVTLLSGLSTMMQDKVDFASQSQRTDYLEWKSKVLAQIKSLQATT